MTLISTFSGVYCNIDPVLAALSKRTRYRKILDADIIAEAHQAFDTPKAKLEMAFSSDHSAFNRFTHEREYCIAQIKYAVARQVLEAGGLLIHGFAGQLISKKIDHNLRVCLIADMKYRIANLAGEKNVSEKQALEMIGRSDQDCALWLHSLYQRDDPWDPALYDIVAPTDKLSTDDIADLVCENLNHRAVQPTQDSRQAVEDFMLAARSEVEMLRAGHDVHVTADAGSVELSLKRSVLLRDRLETEFEAILEKVPGVQTFRISTPSKDADMSQPIPFSETHQRIMLVDDEREFVQTLSERLMTRQIPTTVEYSGEAALETIRERTPEVMILDLKMPGINGLEVLKRVKSEHPEVEVIILTGHGSEADREACMAMGAYAYLEKPVDIDALSEAIRQVYRKGKRDPDLGGSE